MKYLILGCNGMAGHVISQYLVEKGHSVVGFARQGSNICETLIGDACDKNTVEKLLQGSKFDIVVNCIGILNKAVEEKLSIGIYLNSVLPHFIAEKLQHTDTRLIHISTDCVFNGRKGKYREDDKPDADSIYGISKSLGEVVDQKNLTIRTSIIGPELKRNGVGLFHWFMSQNQAVEGYAGVEWSGVTTLQLAKEIEKMAVSPITGLYHLVNNDTINKYDLISLFNIYCRTNKLEIIKNINISVDKSLVNTRVDYKVGIPSYHEMVEEMAMWIRNHRELYEQYNIEGMV